MANHLDFLLVLDNHVRSSATGSVTDAWNMRLVAQEAGLADPTNSLVPFWTGRLVQLQFVTAVQGGGTPPVPPGVSWTDYEINRFFDFTVTALGHQEADRIRRIQREEAGDAALGLWLAGAGGTALAGAQGEAIVRPLRDLRAALDDGRSAAAIGAAKELAEAACKIALERTGVGYGRRDSLTVLFRKARSAVAADDGGVAPSVASTVDALMTLRNLAGSGHGRATESAGDVAQARLAAGAASAIAAFVLTAASEQSPGFANRASDNEHESWR